MLKALIFDVDGTLADTERDGHRVAFNRAFAQAGLEWNWSVKEYGRLLQVTGGRERIRHYMDINGVKESTSLINRVHAIKTKHYIQIIHDGEIRLRPGVRRLTAEAKSAGLKLAIATTTSRANVDALLRRSLPDVFDIICAAEDAASKKPDPLVYRVSLQRLGLSADECVAIEDSSAGLRSATEAGIATIITVNDYTRDQDFSGAHEVLSDLGEPGAPPYDLSGGALLQGFVDVAHASLIVDRRRHRLRATR